MSIKAWTVFFLMLLLTAAGATGVAAGQDKAQDRAPRLSSHARGVAHFERGFYEYLPKGRAAEAAAEFDLAVREFKAVLELNPSQVESHRALARVYRIQEKYLLAAKHYEKVTELNPLDIDAYVMAAEALAAAGRFEESGLMLERAKTRTADPVALRALDGYLQKLAEAERESGKND